MGTGLGLRPHVYRWIAPFRERALLYLIHITYQKHFTINSMRTKLLLLLICVCSLSLSDLYAQRVMQDVVYLKNGSRIRGIVIEFVPSKGVKIETSDGSLFAFKEAEIERIVREQSPERGALGGSALDRGGYLGLSLGISASPSLEQLGGRIDLIDFGYLLHKNIGLSAKVGASVYEVSSVSINGVPQYDDARLILGRVLAGGLFSFSTGKHGRIELKPMIGLGWASVTKVATSSAMFAWEAGAQYRLHLGRSTDLMTGLSYSGLGEFTDFALTLGFAFRLR